MILGSASAGLAQEPDAGAQPAGDPGTPKQEAEDKHPRLVKPEGNQDENKLLGEEPSLTETTQEPAAKVDGEADSGDVAEIPRLRRLPRTVGGGERPRTVARESGSIDEEVKDE